MKENYQILLVEPSFIIREGLYSIIKSLSGDMILDVFSSYEDFLNEGNKKEYDLVLINTAELLSDSQLLEHFNQTIIIGILSGVGHRFIINQLNDVIYINDSEKQILEIINKNIKKNKEQKLTNRLLTEREIDVLKLLVKGNTSKEIAEKLFISVHTVITHRKNITIKLGIKTTAALAIYAVTANILDEDDILNDH